MVSVAISNCEKNRVKPASSSALLGLSTHLAATAVFGRFGWASVKLANLFLNPYMPALCQGVDHKTNKTSK